MRAALEARRFRSAAPGHELSLLVLAASSGSLAAVDLDSGALVRARYPRVGATDLEPFDVVAAPVDRPHDVPDPSQPEHVDLADLPTWTGHLGARHAERFLRPLLHPAGVQLLGFAGPAVPYYELEGTRPSMALVAARPHLIHREDGPRCRFAWRGLIHDLPLVDRRARQAMREGRRLGGANRLLVALTPPRDGYCHKVVAALL